jgi:hypothetical protein
LNLIFVFIFAAIINSKRHEKENYTFAASALLRRFGGGAKFLAREKVLVFFHAKWLQVLQLLLFRLG